MWVSVHLEGRRDWSLEMRDCQKEDLLGPNIPEGRGLVFGGRQNLSVFVQYSGCNTVLQDEVILEFRKPPEFR